MEPVLKRIGDVTIERVVPQQKKPTEQPEQDAIETGSELSVSDEELTDDEFGDLEETAVNEKDLKRKIDQISDVRPDISNKKSKVSSVNEEDTVVLTEDNEEQGQGNANTADGKIDNKQEKSANKQPTDGNESIDEMSDDEYETSDSECEEDSSSKKIKLGTSPGPIDIEKTDFIKKLTQGLPFDNEASSNENTSSSTVNIKNEPESSDYDYDITEKLREMGEISVQTVKKGEKTQRKVAEPESEISVTAAKSKRNTDSDTEDEEQSGAERKIGTTGNLRRNIREVMDETQLDEATLAAQRQEMERLRRVQEQQRIIREVQRQIALNRQNQRTQHRVISLLQGNSSIVKQTPGSSGSGTQAGRVGSTVLVKLPNGETKPMTRIPKSHAPFEMVRVHKQITPGKGVPRNLMSVKGNLTPSVSIAPVSKRTLPPSILDGEAEPHAPSAEVKIPGKPKKDVVTISSSSDDDCIVLSEDDEPPEPEPDEDPCNSGMHTNDTYNIPDEQGRVLVNVGHPENEPDIYIASQIARIIKPHQIGGVRFLFDNVIESIDRFNTSTGFGCILAHSMGLGKTLQVVCFSDIFLRHTSAKTILCIMPINTLQNWMAEFNMWLPKDASSSPLQAQGEVRERNFNLHVLNDSHKSLTARAKVIQEWNKDGGVLLIGYELYRLLSLKRNSRAKKKKKPSDVVDLEEDDKNKTMFDEIHAALVKPGPDLVICDEGHRIKNSHASISQALKQIRSKRRVVLTGYPLQNNLLEYWCMVDFVRPNYLGTKTEFSNMFERPIQNGQCIDSTPQDIRLMRYRAHVLHSLLEGFVQRRSHAVLQMSLPQKEEYVMLVRMTEFQRKLYDTFMNEVVRTKAVPNPLKAFAVCCKIWNHPDVLYYFLKKRAGGDAVDIDLEEVAGVVPVQTGGTTAVVPQTKPKRPRKPRPRKDKKGNIKEALVSETGDQVPDKPAASVQPNTTNRTESTPPKSSNVPPQPTVPPPPNSNQNTPPEFPNQTQQPPYSPSNMQYPNQNYNSYPPNYPNYPPNNQYNYYPTDGNNYGGNYYPNQGENYHGNQPDSNYWQQQQPQQQWNNSEYGRNDRQPPGNNYTGGNTQPTPDAAPAANDGQSSNSQFPNNQQSPYNNSTNTGGPSSNSQFSNAPGTPYNSNSVVSTPGQYSSPPSTGPTTPSGSSEQYNRNGTPPTPGQFENNQTTPVPPSGQFDNGTTPFTPPGQFENNSSSASGQFASPQFHGGAPPTGTQFNNSDGGQYPQNSGGTQYNQNGPQFGAGDQSNVTDPSYNNPPPTQPPNSNENYGQSNNYYNNAPPGGNYNSNYYGPPYNNQMYNPNMYGYNQPYPQQQQWGSEYKPDVKPWFNNEPPKTEIKDENKPDIQSLDVKQDIKMETDEVKTELKKEIDTDDTEKKLEKDSESSEIKEEAEIDPVTAAKPMKEDAGIPYDWATELLKGYTPGILENSAKMEILFCIIRESMALSDRILLFSQSLFTLNLIEEFLQKFEVPGTTEKWLKNTHYYRLDGSTSALEREKLINEFNSNPNIHLFMVSTRAGSLGINLVGANRVIVFDASWNPCHDTQAVCRVYRYGQKKPCFVYRIVMDNCLEKKIYDRQINKQGMSDRVVDECNPDAHLSMKDVTNLCWDDEEESEVKDFSSTKDKYIDVVMQKILDNHSHVLSKEPFQHESLLVDRKEKKLSQAEKRLAKRSYELEKQAVTNAARPIYGYHTGALPAGMRMHNKPIASVRPMQAELNSQIIRGDRAGTRSRWIPAEVWQRQGMTAQEMTLPLDVVIPTNGGERGNIVLKAGQKVLVLKSPKGIYMQLECGKIVAIRTAMKVRGSATGGAKGAGGGHAGEEGAFSEGGTTLAPVKKVQARINMAKSNIPMPLKNNSAVTIIPKSSPQKIVKPFTQVNAYAKMNRQIQGRSIQARIQNIRHGNINIKGINPTVPPQPRNIQFGKAKPFNIAYPSTETGKSTGPVPLPETDSNASRSAHDHETHFIHSSDEDVPKITNITSLREEEFESQGDESLNESNSLPSSEKISNDHETDSVTPNKQDETVPSSEENAPIESDVKTSKSVEETGIETNNVAAPNVVSPVEDTKTSIDLTDDVPSSDVSSSQTVSPVPVMKPTETIKSKSSLKNYRHNFSSQKSHQQKLTNTNIQQHSALHKLEQTTSAIGDRSKSNPSLQKSLNEITNSYPNPESEIKAEIIEKPSHLTKAKDVDVPNKVEKSKPKEKIEILDITELPPIRRNVPADHDRPREMPRNYPTVDPNAQNYNYSYGNPDYYGYNPAPAPPAPMPPYGNQPYYNPTEMGAKQKTESSETDNGASAPQIPANPNTNSSDASEFSASQDSQQAAVQLQQPSPANAGNVPTSSAQQGFAPYPPQPPPPMNYGPPGQYPPNYQGMPPYPPNNNYQPPPYQPLPGQFDQNYSPNMYGGYHPSYGPPPPATAVAPAAAGPAGPPMGSAVPPAGPVVPAAGPAGPPAEPTIPSAGLEAPPPADGVTYGPPPPQGAPYAPRHGYPQYPPYAPPQPVYPGYGDYNQYNAAPAPGYNQYMTPYPAPNSNPPPP